MDEIRKDRRDNRLGGTGVLMQGGLHPDFGVEWYEIFCAL